MKFTLAKTHLYWWPVTVRIPDPDSAGKFLTQELKVRFEPLPRDEALALSDAAAKLTTLREITDHEIAQFTRVIRDWSGVVDEQGADVPFSEEMLAAAMQTTWFRAAIGAALQDSLAGEAPRLGN